MFKFNPVKISKYLIYVLLLSTLMTNTVLAETGYKAKDLIVGYLPKGLSPEIYYGYLDDGFENGKISAYNYDTYDYSYFDTSGNVVNNSVEYLVSDLLVDYNYENGLYGYVNSNYETVIEHLFVNAYDFQDGLALVYDGDYYGYIDENGNNITPFMFTDAERFINGYACVSNDDKWGLIDTSGDIVIPIEYDYIRDYFSEGIIVAEKDEKYGCLDKSGKVVIPFEYNYIDDFSEGIVATSIKDGKFGYIDNQGNAITDFIYDDASAFNNGVATAEIFNEDGPSKYYVINNKGETILSTDKFAIYEFKNGLAPVVYFGENNPYEDLSEDHYVGFINNKGRLIISFVKSNQYTDKGILTNFNDNYAILGSGNGKFAILKSPLLNDDYNENLGELLTDI